MITNVGSRYQTQAPDTAWHLEVRAPDGWEAVVRFSRREQALATMDGLAALHGGGVTGACAEGHWTWQWTAGERVTCWRLREVAIDDR